MPWEIRQNGNQHCIYKQGTDQKVACHGSHAEAMAQMRALYANTSESMNKPQTITESAIELRQMVEGTSGREWEIKIISPGVSKNGVLYTPDVLQEAAARYEGAYSYERHSNGERGFRERIGRLHGVQYREGADAGLWAQLRVINPTVREMLLEAAEAGELGTIGFSHDVLAASEPAVHEGRRVRKANRIEAVNSVDMVERPSAGGRMARLVAGEMETDMDRDEILAVVKEANEGLAGSISASLASALKEVFAAQQPKPVAEEAQPQQEADKGGSPTDFQKALREATVERQRGALHRRLAETKLSTPGQAFVKEGFEHEVARRAVTDQEVEAMVTRQIDYEALFQQNSRPIGNAGVRFEVGAAPRQDFVRDLYATYAGASEKIAEGARPFSSLREAYCKFTGEWDTDWETMMENWVPARGYRSGRDHKRIQESITTASWGEINADVMYQRLMKAYADSPEYDRWRVLVSDIENVPDFRTRHWMRFGGYGNLPAVNEGATYQNTTSPTDEEVTYTISKRGLLEDITMESMMNDQVGVVRRIPTELGRAASRTLYQFVLNMVTTDNPMMDYDSTALYHANHNNTGTTALSVAGLNTTQQAMRDQTPYNQSSEVLGARNKLGIIIVPNELTARANRIVNPSDAYAYGLNSTPDADTSLDPHQFKGSGITVLTNDYMTDATDWFAVADPNMAPTVVMGFLGGRQEPELFVQDNPTVGSPFASDKIVYKIRHIYGGDVLEHRSFYRQVVAG